MLPKTSHASIRFERIDPGYHTMSDCPSLFVIGIRLFHRAEFLMNLTPTEGERHNVHPCDHFSQGVQHATTRFSFAVRRFAIYRV